MRISILGCRGIPSSYSGFETFVQELAPRLVAAGHEVTVFCRSALFSERPADYLGVKLRYMPSIEHKILSTITHSTLCMFAACASRSDLILVVNSVNGWLGVMGRMLGKRTVINVNGMEWMRPKWNPMARRVFRYSTWLGIRCFDAVVTDAYAMREVYEDVFAHSPSVIPYGGDSLMASAKSLTATERDSYVSARGLVPQNYFLVVGRRIPDNNIDLIIRGYVATQLDMPLVIVGGADYRGNDKERQYFDYCRSLSNERVLFLGQVHDQLELECLWSACYVYIHGHQYGGTNPSLLRALNNGCLVAALDTPFNREVLDHGACGFLFPRDHRALAELLNDLVGQRRQYSEYRRSATRRIQDAYTWDAVTQAYLDLFESLERR